MGARSKISYAKAAHSYALEPHAQPHVTVDFTSVFIRRALQPALANGAIKVTRAPRWGITVVHQYVSEWNGRRVSMPIAQLRARGQLLQLFWKRANGRWVPYQRDSCEPLVASLSQCMKEIREDRLGCFWG